MKRDENRISVFLPPELRGRLDEFADAVSLPRSACARMLIARALDSLSPLAPPATPPPAVDKKD